MRAALLARSGSRLSEWVDAIQLDTLMKMLAAIAAARPTADWTRTATTGDDLWTVRSEPAPAGQPSAVVHTPQGRLGAPEHPPAHRRADQA